MPEFMKSIKLFQPSIPPSPEDDKTIIYGTPTGISITTMENQNSALDVGGIVKEFDYTDSVISLGYVPKGLSVSNVVVEILEIFDDILSIITIGDSIDQSVLMDASSNDATNLGTYSLGSNYSFNDDTEIFVYINSGSSIQGSGTIRVYFD
jgi:hypothetical protein